MRQRIVIAASLAGALTLGGVAFAATAWSSWSELASVITPFAEEQDPEEEDEDGYEGGDIEVETPTVTVTADSPTSALIEWSDVSGDTCEIERNGDLLADVDHDDRAYHDQGLEPGSNYDYRVRCSVAATDPDPGEGEGPSDPSDPDPGEGPSDPDPDEGEDTADPEESDPVDSEITGHHSGFTVDEGQTVELLGDVTTDENVVVYGTLKMRAGSSLTFTDVDEDAFTGPGDATEPIAADVGLWVFGSGQLDIVGTEKQGWNRTGTHRTWDASDDYVSAPQDLDDRQPVPWSFGDEVPCVEFAGEDYCTEIVNLTRDVVIQGTDSGQAHIFVRSDQPQTVRYAELRHLGPNGDTDEPDGRYPLHFHMMHDGSRGSLIEGVVVRDSDDHAFVPHHSDGMTFRDTVAYNVSNTAYWWDEGDSTDDVRYERALALHVQGNRDSGASLAGFRMGKGEGNTCVECVATAVRTGRASAGFQWTAGDNYWTFRDSTSHNNHNGVYHWQNDPFAEEEAHYHSGFTTYRNSFRGIEQGAYTIQAFWDDTVSFGNSREAIVNRGHPRHGVLEPGIAYRGGKLGAGNKRPVISAPSARNCGRNAVLFEDLQLFPENGVPAIHFDHGSCAHDSDRLDYRFVNLTVGTDQRPLRKSDFRIDALPPGGTVTVENSDGTTFQFEG